MYTAWSRHAAIKTIFLLNYICAAKQRRTGVHSTTYRIILFFNFMSLHVIMDYLLLPYCRIIAAVHHGCQYEKRMYTFFLFIFQAIFVIEILEIKFFDPISYIRHVTIHTPWYSCVSFSAYVAYICAYIYYIRLLTSKI